MPHTILMERLLEYGYPKDPWGAGFHISMVRRAKWKLPISFSRTEDVTCAVGTWTGAQHAARLRAIMDNEQWYNDPIWLDNQCRGPHIFAIPDIVDGYHRFFAHLVKKDLTIRVCYAGRSDLLRYLQGHRKTPPL